tara:strand:+ start:1039 stop:1950 length:912 start_codon:yes stop_codon:yes gene_type:complete
MRGVQANQAAQVRMFAHDAIPVAIGAINPDNGITLNSGGYGFSVGDVIALTAPTGGAIAKLIVTSIGNSNIFTIQVNSGKFHVDAGQAPALTLNRGKTYQFYQTLSSNSPNHYLRLSTTSDGTHGGGSQYLDGWDDNSGVIGENWISTFTVPQNAPDTLHYYCSDHVNMGNQITIQDSGVDSTPTDAIKSFDLVRQSGAKPFGKGYAVGNMVQSIVAIPPSAVSGGFNGNVASIDLPSTTERGACIYIGNKMATLTVKMESGESATFQNILAGAFMPILIKEVTTATLEGGSAAGDNDVIALY